MQATTGYDRLWLVIAYYDPHGLLWFFMTYDGQELKERIWINERCAVCYLFQLINVGNEPVHEIDTVCGSQKLCSHQAPRHKRRRWMALWMVMSKPRKHIVVCWENTECKTCVETDPQDSKVQKEEKPGKARRHRWFQLQPRTLLIFFILPALFAGADLLIFWGKTKNTFQTHMLYIPDLIAYVYIITVGPWDLEFHTATQCNGSL